ncbi:MAG TPA: DUF167 domain-containing protein [Chloroflexia bacterium]|jgi:hypothetical protein
MLDTSSYGIEATPTGVTIRVYVAPRSSANKVVGVYNGALKVALTAPPVEGAANKALVEFFAKTLGVPKSAVKLIAGETSRHKVLSILGVGAQATLTRLVEVS